MTTDVPVFPAGTHDIVKSTNGGVTTIRCVAGDWTVDAHTDAEIAWATRAAYTHSAARQRGMCHAACYDEHGHTDGCLYDGEDG